MIGAARCALRRFGATMALGMAVALAVAALPAAYAELPRIETRFLPVVTKFRIDAAEWADPVRLNIYVRFTKRRPCQFVAQNWYVVMRANGEDYRARIPMLFLDRQPNESTWSRPTGDNRAGPWQVVIPSGLAEPEHLTVIHHDCGLPWQTVTEAGPIDLRAILAQRPSPG